MLWVNLWATWCKPCIEEMPMLAAWQTKLAADGKRVALQFVSVDETADLVSAFRVQHPDVPASERILDPKTLAPFVAEIGLDSGAGLPIHIFVESGKQIRCVRSGAVTEAHYDVIASLF